MRQNAKGGIPNNIWETYSSFANTDGGLILLGVRENSNHTFSVEGIDNPEKVKILIGNHDANYIVPDLYGWQYEHKTEIKKMILRNLEYIDLGFMAGRRE